MLHRILFVAMLAMSALASAPVVPKKVELKQEQPKKMPDMAFTCQFGVITQNGASIQITGNPSWEALGLIREDNGKLQVIWTRLGSNEPCPGIYEFKDGGFVGHWGEAGPAWIDAKGELAGVRRDETLYKVKPPAPNFE
jgi:hypothetical protein